jgi:hypothetical protein
MDTYPAQTGTKRARPDDEETEDAASAAASSAVSDSGQPPAKQPRVAEPADVTPGAVPAGRAGGGLVLDLSFSSSADVSPHDGVARSEAAADEQRDAAASPRGASRGAAPLHAAGGQGSQAAHARHGSEPAATDAAAYRPTPSSTAGDSVAGAAANGKPLGADGLPPGLEGNLLEVSYHRYHHGRCDVFGGRTACRRIYTAAR